MPEEPSEDPAKAVTLTPEMLEDLKKEITQKALEAIAQSVPPEILTAAYMRGFDAGFQAGMKKADEVLG